MSSRSWTQMDLISMIWKWGLIPYQQCSTALADSCSSAAIRFELPWTLFSPSVIRMVPFPTREYTDDEFQSIVKSVMGLLYLLGFLFPISRLISYSVFEKEQKIREGLYMMGLKDEIFHLSWFITYALQLALCSGIITACTMGSLFKYSETTLVFTYFFLFGVSAIMLSFMFTRAKTVVAVGTVAFLGAFFPYYTVNDESVSIVLKVVATLLSPTAFALGHVTNMFSRMSSACHKYGFLVARSDRILTALKPVGR
ncbi:PREDICTED: ABC transporter A family member 1 isoform X2 [Camelina sativa]|uniref:ABC transporter A family member 1 isoform X2 n=1 Tax=Camelina sativa TaxID=90675 RepID=A0ABM0T737_CAMSA|nr:PREDICTED: ABC transporter A family member 1 isoform X2 [Camelina sativa]